MKSSLSADFPVVRISWQVLRRDKKLLLFALLESISVILMLFSIGAIAEACRGLWLERLIYVPVVLVALGIAILIYFFNIALTRCAIIRFQGGMPSLRDGMKFSLSRLPQIFALLVWWPTFKLVRFLYSVSERMGRLVGRLLGVTGEILSADCGTWWYGYFLLPVLVTEGGSAIHVITRSVLLWRKMQGWPPLANALGNDGLMILLTVIPGPLMFVGGAFLAMATNALVFKIICLIGGPVFVVMFTLMIALNGISSVALYQHVVLSEIASEPDTNAMAGDPPI